MSNAIDDQSPVETLEDCAMLISSFVAEGRIGPTNPTDAEALTVLSWLSVLARRKEPKPGV